jgi:hypothetical protein
MTLSSRRQLRIVTATVGLFIAGALLADRTLAQGPCSFGSCPTMSLTANLQLTNLHSAVTHVQINCRAMRSGAFMASAASARAAVVNRAFTGSVTASIGVPPFQLADPLKRTLDTTCQLEFVNGNSTMAADASATQPLGMLPDNWHVVAAGSTVTWSQAVTFPNANATP